MRRQGIVVTLLLPKASKKVNSFKPIDLLAWRIWPPTFDWDMYVPGQSEVFNVHSPECAVNLFAWNIFCISCLWKLSPASKNLHWYLLERQTCWTTLICHSSTSSLTNLTWVKGIWSNSSTGQPLKAESLFYPLIPHDVRKWGKGRRPLSALSAAPESVPVWEER